MAKDKNKSKGFFRENWKELLAIGGVFLTGIVTVLLSSKNGENNSFDYSEKWLKNATDDEINTEREKVRIKFNDGTVELRKTIRLENTLRRFDNEISDRAWGGRKDYGYPASREHGWHLPNKD